MTLFVVPWLLLTASICWMSSPLSVKQCQVTGFTDFTAEKKSEVFQCPPGCSSTALIAMVALLGGSSAVTFNLCHITGTTTQQEIPFTDPFPA